MEKKCFKCGEVKPLSEYYKHPKMGDGHLGKCKVCTKADVREREELLWKDPKWAKQERERHRAKQEKYRKLGLASPTTQETRERWAQKNPHKIKAHRLAANAIRSGKIKRRDWCDDCGATGRRLEAHHDDYSKPLEVRFLCCSCHGKTKHK